MKYNTYCCQKIYFLVEQNFQLFYLWIIVLKFYRDPTLRESVYYKLSLGIEVFVALLYKEHICSTCKIGAIFDTSKQDGSGTYFFILIILQSPKVTCEKLGKMKNVTMGNTCTIASVSPINKRKGEIMKGYCEKPDIKNKITIFLWTQSDMK